MSEHEIPPYRQDAIRVNDFAKHITSRVEKALQAVKERSPEGTVSVSEKILKGGVATTTRFESSEGKFAIRRRVINDPRSVDPIIKVTGVRVDANGTLHYVGATNTMLQLEGLFTAGTINNSNGVRRLGIDSPRSLLAINGFIKTLSDATAVLPPQK